MMKYLLLIVFLLLLATQASANEERLDKIEEKVDRVDKKVEVIDKKIDAVAERQGAILHRVEHDPFKNRSFGVEFNLVRLLYFEQGLKTLSGGASFFNAKKKTEIAFPVFLSTSENIWGQSYSFASVDVHYRKYLGRTLDGFYFSGFARSTYINGPLGSDYYSIFDDAPDERRGNEFKIGVGVGIGYRVLSETGYYWGVGLIVGRYLIGENDKFSSDTAFDEDLKFILDAELLKFGYAF